MQPLVNTCMATLSEGSDVFDYSVSLFCDPCCPVYTASHLIMRRREKKLWNWAATSPCWRVDPGGYSLIEAIQVWAGPKDMVEVLLCLVPGLYLFYSILLLVYYLFIYLFFYLSMHSPFYESGLGSEGNHFVISHRHPNFPGVPPGAAGRVHAVVN